MDLGLRDKVAIVAGATRGIGKATALTLATEGCHVALAARGEEALRRAAAEVEEAGAQAPAALPTTGGEPTSSGGRTLLLALIAALGLAGTGGALVAVRQRR